MIMTRNTLVVLAAAGSAALLLGAFGFQIIGYAPCKMCLWQRWPHAAAIAIGGLALVWKTRALPWLGALAMLITAGIGLFHTGVERRWWDGPSSCSGGGDGLRGMSGSDLLSTDIVDRVVMCDEVAWEFLTLSMASWNMLASLALAVVWVLAARRPA